MKYDSFLRRCYGSATVSERGQVVIPLEARKELGFEPGTKLLVFAASGHGGLVLVPAEALTQFISQAISRLADLEAMTRRDAQSEGSD